MTARQAKRRRKLAMQRDNDAHLARWVASKVNRGIIYHREVKRALKVHAPWLRGQPHRMRYVNELLEKLILI